MYKTTRIPESANDNENRKKRTLQGAAQRTMAYKIKIHDNYQTKERLKVIAFMKHKSRWGEHDVFTISGRDVNEMTEG